MGIVETITQPTFLALYALCMVLLFMVVFSAKYVFFGLNAFFKKPSGKYGLVFLRLPDNNIMLPKFHNMEKTEFELKRKGVKKVFPMHRNDFQDGKFFGFPYCIKDIDDAVRSYGLYAEEFQEVIDPKTQESKFEPVYERFQKQDENGQIHTYETSIPKLTKEKGSFRVDPEIIDGLISKNSILSSIKDLFQKHNLMFVGIIVVGVLVLVSLYLGYENMTMMQEQILPALEQLKGNIAEQSANAASNGGTQNVPINQ